MKQQKYLCFVAMVAVCFFLMTLGIDTQASNYTTSILRISKQNSIDDTVRRNIPEIIRFTDNTTFRTLDENGDGLAEAVIADVEVQILTGGEYSFIGTLKKNEQNIANRPFFESAIFSSAFLNEAIGLYTISLRFSGEQIFRSGQNGPYQLELFAIGANNFATTLISTPAYDYTQFSEIGIQASKNGILLTGVTEVAIDETGDGKFDFIETTVSVEVRTAGKYRLQGTLSKDDTSIVNIGIVVTLMQGIHKLKLPFSGLPIRRWGLDGPYEGLVSIYDANDHALGSLEFVTLPYHSTTFRALLEFDGTFNDHGIDTNGNGLFDILRIDFGARFNEEGTFLVRGVLTNHTLQNFVFTETLVTLPTNASQTFTLNFQGPLIYEQNMEGPYQVEVLVQNPDTFEDLDRVQLEPITKTYHSTDFEPLDKNMDKTISITDKYSDEGVESDDNGLFYESHVEQEKSSSVGLHSFTAITEMEGTRLTWKIISFAENYAGFRLWRAIKDEQEEYAVTVLQPERLFHQGDCIKGELKSADSDKPISMVEISTKEFCYSFVDISIKNKEDTYYYVLEDVDTTGKRTFHCDAIAVATISKGLAPNLEATKTYCQQVTGSGN